MIRIMIITFLTLLTCAKNKRFFFSSETRNANLYERINKAKRSMGPAMRLG